MQYHLLLEHHFRAIDNTCCALPGHERGLNLIAADLQARLIPPTEIRSWSLLNLSSRRATLQFCQSFELKK